MAAKGQNAANTVDQAAGRLLRAFRLEHDTTEAYVAARLGVAHNTISDYELGVRGRRKSRQDFLPVLAQYAEAVQAGPELIHLWQAIPTPMAPREKWEHNAYEQGKPVWLWLRPLPERTRLVASLWWGNPFRGRIDLDCTSDGVLIQFPTSVVNPGLHVHLSEPGWSDFGPGDIPPAVAAAIGTVWVDAVDLLGENDSIDGPLETVDHELESSVALIRRVVAQAPVLRRLNLRWKRVQPHLGALSSSAPEGALDSYALAAATAAHPPVLDADGVASQVLLPLDILVELRVARGYSRASAAKRLATGEFAGAPLVTDRQIELFEKIGSSSLPLLASRLDTLLGAGGRLGIERVFRSDASNTPQRRRVVFPTWWVGPIWIKCIGPRPDAVASVSLTWGLWWRRQRVRSQMVLTTRKAFRNDDPLFVSLPAHWKLTAGLGAVPTAWDVNRDWFPISPRAAATIVLETVQAVAPQLRAAQKRREERLERARTRRRHTCAEPGDGSAG